MLRRVLYFILALTVFALIVAVFDGVRHERAIVSLEKKAPGCIGDWHYRISGLKVPIRYPNIGAENWRGILQRTIASPRKAYFANFGIKPDGIVFPTLDRSMFQELGKIGIEDLAMENCIGLSSEMVTDLSRASSIRILYVNSCGLTNEESNFLWSEMPGLETVTLMEFALTDDGFRDVRAARNLRRVCTMRAGDSTPLTDQAIAYLCEAPQLEELELVRAELTEKSAPLLAAMPVLKRLTLWSVSERAVIRNKLRVLNPQIVVVLKP